MSAAQYKPDGEQWPKVQSIMSICSCSRIRAVSALKSCNNDEAAAISSIKDALSMSTTSMKSMSLNSASDDLGKISDHGNKAVFQPDNAGLEVYQPVSNMKISRDLPAYHAPESVQAIVPKPAASQDKDSDLPEVVQPVRYTDNSHVHVHAPPVTQQPTTSVPPNTSSVLRPISGRLASKPPNYASQPSSETPRPTGSQWNFVLPKILLDGPDTGFLIDDAVGKSFSIRGIISAMQNGVKRGKLQHYFSFHAESIVAQHMNMIVAGFPAIFYAVATNDDKIVRMWINNGGDVNAVDEKYGVPLLGFAILMADILGVHTTTVTVTLLSLGADVSVIPSVFFTPYLDDPPAKAPFNHREFGEPRKQWCAEYMRPVLARAVNLTQRYFLEKMAKEKRPSERQMQVAVAHNATALLGVSYFLIGQSSAAKTVTQKLLSHMALPRTKPLVMVFAGPSGHGKTELAKRMGELLSLELECIDCTEMKHETDLFGPKKPYIGHEKGSPLNNFLTRLTGRRCIVFLDEFEKTTREVQNALLVPFDEGKYTDRRNRQPVDCSKTIWILATNALDDTILGFCDSHPDEIYDTSDALRHGELMADLSNKLKKQLKSTFGNPLSGRVSLVLPFLPFSPSESAVIVHKYLLELQSNLAQSIQLSGQQMVGRIALSIKNDGAVCSLLAEEGYDADQGARSLKSAVELRVADELVAKYLDEDGRIEDEQAIVGYTLDISRGGALVVFKSAASRMH